MTYRSRSGGPQRQKHGAGSKNKPSRKLHHPPPKETDGSEDSPLPSAAFLDTPSDGDILEVIHHALKGTLDSPNFSATVQKVKSLLYDKKWLELFEDKALLESYAGRWVPSRALCFRELFAGLRDVRGLFTAHDDEAGSESGDDDDQSQDQAASPHAESSTTRILSLGGGASSELIAVAALAQACRSAETKVMDTNGKGKAPMRWEWSGIDIGEWGSIVDKFTEAIRAEWELEEDLLRVNFRQGDLLSSNVADVLATSLSPAPSLITVLFTLTELMSQSRPATISLIHHLTKSCPPGTLLLVADSASDISEFEMGSSGRKWPIYMILDTLLLGPPGKTGEWEAVRKEDSRWYRLPEGVGSGWTVKLENTRYWMRLYRRT